MEVDNDFSYWKEIASVLGFGVLWWKSGREAGKVEQTVKHIAEETASLKRHLEGVSSVTPEFCDECQKRCQERTWDRFLLAIEKRDREFDKKFSHICQGLTEIKAEIRRTNP